MVKNTESPNPNALPIDIRPLRKAGFRGAVRILQERWDRPAFAALASVSLIGLGLIIFFIFKEAIPLIGETTWSNFFGLEWFPTSDPVNKFGVVPLIIGSVMVTTGALALAIPIGLASATFIAEVAPGVLKDVAKAIVELLAGIPSVVYGFFGLLVLGPWLQRTLNLPTGRTALTASIILGIMALPTIASLAEDALTAVPNSYREASMATGASRWQTIWRVTFPSAFSGIMGAVVLGLGRAVGETMAVLMVSGNAAQITGSYLKPVRTLTATIALEMAETPFGSEHYHALFAIGAMLLITTLIMNGLAEWFRGRVARKHAS